MQTTTKDLGQNPQAQSDGHEVETASSHSHSGNDEQNEGENEEDKRNHANRIDAAFRNALKNAQEPILDLFMPEPIDDSPEAQNAMLDRWKECHAGFGPRPTHTAPVFHTDAERLEEARKALREIMELSFGARPSCGPEHPLRLKRIWNVANIALSRTSKAEAVDTVP